MTRRKGRLRKTRRKRRIAFLTLILVFLLGGVVLLAITFNQPNIKELCLVGVSGLPIKALDINGFTEEEIPLFNTLPTSHRYSLVWMRNKLYVGLTNTARGYVYQIDLKEETIEELEVSGTVMDMQSYGDYLYVVTINYLTKKSHLIKIDCTHFSIADQTTLSKYAPGTPYELAVNSDGKLFIVSHNSSSGKSYLSAFSGLKHLKTVKLVGGAALHVEVANNKVYVRSRDELLVYSTNTLTLITRIPSLYGYGAIKFHNGKFYVAGMTREGKPQLYVLDSNLAIQTEIQLTKTTGATTEVTIFKGKIFALGFLHQTGCVIFLVEGDSVEEHILPNTSNSWPSEITCLEVEL